MKKKSVFVILMVFLFSGSITAISSEDIYIPVVSKGFQHQFWQAVRSGAEQAAEDYGVNITYEGPASESEVAIQIDMLQTALDKDPSAIVFAALDSKAAIPLLEQADDVGISIIAFDSGVDSDIPLATAATDNYAAAAKAADRMAEHIGYEGKIALIVHDQTSHTGVQRRDGFMDRINEQYPESDIVDVQYGGGDHLKSTDLAKAIIQAHPDLDGFFGANEGSTVGIINAVTELEKVDELVIIGFDSGGLQLSAIRSGIMTGAVTQNPYGIGYRAVEAAVMALRGEEVPEIIDTGFYWYDKNSIDSTVIQPLVYE
ncbi:MAG: ABC transporter substrate-binding protein [bacterium]